MRKLLNRLTQKQVFAAILVTILLLTALTIIMGPTTLLVIAGAFTTASLSYALWEISGLLTS